MFNKETEEFSTDYVGNEIVNCSGIKGIGSFDDGTTVFIYPEQEMWRNYKKPRPFLVGAFKIACKAGVPVVPIFITMQDSDTLDKDGCPLQKHTVHIMPAVYPDESLGDKERAEAMQKQVQEKYKEIYEQVYKQPLRYSCDEE